MENVLNKLGNLTKKIPGESGESAKGLFHEAYVVNEVIGAERRTH